MARSDRATLLPTKTVGEGFVHGWVALVAISILASFGECRMVKMDVKECF